MCVALRKRFYLSHVLIFFKIRFLLTKWFTSKSGIFDVEMNRYLSICISLILCRNSLLQGRNFESFCSCHWFCCCCFYLVMLLSSKLSPKSDVIVGTLFTQVENFCLHYEVRGLDFLGIVWMKWKISKHIAVNKYTTLSLNVHLNLLLILKIIQVYFLKNKICTNL